LEERAEGEEMVKFDFDTPVNRKGTLSYKWDSETRNMGTPGVLPMWVADMDFRCPQPMLDALQERIEHGVLGYTKRGENYYEIMQSWLRRRFDWTVDTQWLCYCPPGVIPAVTILLDILTKPGDPILMHMPNYDALYGAVEDMGRSLIRCPLIEEEGGFRMDFDLFEDQGDGFLLSAQPLRPGLDPGGIGADGRALRPIRSYCDFRRSSLRSGV
jgi:cystathionine beta-lyase